MGRAKSALFSHSPWRRLALVLVFVFVLALAHLTFRGPAWYAVGRWPSMRPVYWAVYAYTPPLPERPSSEPVRLYSRYLNWWHELGLKHSGRVYGSGWLAPNRTAIPK